MIEKEIGPQVVEGDPAGAVQAAQHARAAMHATFMQAPVAISLVNGPDFVVELANPLYERMVGRRIATGRPFRESFPELPPDAPVFAMLQSILRTGEPFTANEYAVPLDRRGDGQLEEMFFQFVCQPMRDVTGSVTGIMTVAVDVTEQVVARRRAVALADELRRSEELFRVSQEVSPIAFAYYRIVRDDAGEVLDLELRYQNAAAARINRLPLGRDAAGHRLLRDFPALRDTQLWETYKRVAVTGTSGEIESYYGGEHFDAWFRVVAVRPNPDSVALIYEDVTARKAAESEREQLIAALTRSNTDLDQFAYVASHDLKAPLRGISNVTQWIEEDLGDRLTPESRELMELLRGRVHRLEGMIEGILTYSRAGRAGRERERVDVGALVTGLVELLAPPETARIEVAPGMPVLETERVPLQQIFLNLIGNALKHAKRQDPHVRVTWRDADTFWEFAVSDDGPGIAPQYQERIWRIFQTLESRDKVEGAGIGLAVVQKAVETRGGRAWVESAPGAGATFRFTWPKEEKG